jgi:hypothetical protein
MTVTTENAIAANTRIPTAMRASNPRVVLTKPWPCSARASQAVVARAAFKTHHRVKIKLR